MSMDLGPGMNWDEKSDSNTEKKKKEFYEHQEEVKEKLTKDFSPIMKEEPIVMPLFRIGNEDHSCDECDELLENCECEEEESQSSFSISSSDYNSSNSSSIVGLAITAIGGLIVFVVAISVFDSVTPMMNNNTMLSENPIFPMFSALVPIVLVLGLLPLILGMVGFGRRL